jgi:hypothetical protein
MFRGSSENRKRIILTTKSDEDSQLNGIPIRGLRHGLNLRRTRRILSGALTEHDKGHLEPYLRKRR